MPMQPLDAEASTAQKSFEETLNRNGFGFQYRVLRECHEASKTWESRWSFLRSEIPVEVRQTNTKIDFILQHAATGSAYSDMMICECKRVNPAFARWCFIAAPYTGRNHVEV